MNSPNYLSWLSSGYAQAHLLTESQNITSPAESDFSGLENTADPLSCLAQSYKERVMGDALSSFLHPQSDNSRV